MKNKLNISFLIFALLSLFVDIIVIVIFTNHEMQNAFYNSINVASLLVAFFSFIASCYFSLAVYSQAKNQEKINEKLPKKDDQYIIQNYSLFNIEKEFTLFSQSIKNIEQYNNYLYDKDPNKENMTRLVFLPTNSLNKPTYRVNIKHLIINKNDEHYYYKNDEHQIDGIYASNVLQRNYNCICVDINEKIDSLLDKINDSDNIELNIDILSAFNVLFNVTFYIYSNGKKDVSNNPDKKELTDLTTYIIHHTNYVINDKRIYNE